MSKVEFSYIKGSKKVLMARRYAETLQKLGHGTFTDGTYQTRMLATEPVKPAVVEILISEAVAVFAEEHGIDIKTLVGTGKDGRINKSDVEAAIKDQDLA